MWTPRRIFLALAGLLGVATSYFGYSHLLGSFDGLPPLPAQFIHDANSRNEYTEQAPQASTTDRKIALAFGESCAELRYPIKLEMRKHGVLFASHRFEIIKEGPRAGWVEMAPLSLAAFGKSAGPGGIPEINTVYCDVAYLKFDRPIRTMSDFDGRKVAAAELHADPEARLSDPRKGRVRLINNRRTLDPNDDVEMVTPGPVYFTAEPRPGQPHIYTFTEVQLFDHLNTELPEPDYTHPRPPTMAGVGLRVVLIRETNEKDKEKSPPPPGKTMAKKTRDTAGTINGVESVGLEHSVELNLWTDSSTSFIAPGGKPGEKKSEASKKDGPPPVKRLLQVKTNGPFRYDLRRELAHFEKPAISRPGLVEHVTVTRSGAGAGQDLLDCEYLDIQFQRRPPQAAQKDGPPQKSKESEKGKGEGDLEMKSIRAWGETVVITSDSENLHATGTELFHDADAKMTILKGSAQQQVQAVKDGNLLRGSEMHLFGDGKEITQAHILGAGSIGLGELDPKTGEYQKQATWTDRLVYSRLVEKDQPLDVFTLLGKDGTRATFKDTSSGQLQLIEGLQLKVWLKPANVDKGKDARKPAKKVQPKPQEPKNAKSVNDTTNKARPMRLEGTGDVRSTSPDLIIRHADYLNVVFNEVDQLMKPKPAAKDPKAPAIEKGPKATELKGPVVSKINPKGLPKIPLEKKEEPKKEEPKKKIPFVISGKSIESRVNRDPEGRTEIDHVNAVGDVRAHQDPATKDKLGTDVIGERVDVDNHADGFRMVVIGDSAQQPEPKWGVVRSDKLTVFGFDIVIDQRSDTAVVRGEGSMEIISASDMEGKTLEKPTTIHVYWKHRMDFWGAEKQIHYHGGVQAYQDASRLKCEWMQVLLDRPVYLDPERRDKARPPQQADPKGKAEDSNPKIDTIMCFHAPKDESMPRPKLMQPVLMVEEVRENGKLVKFQSIQAPEVEVVNTPLEKQKSQKNMKATSSETLPGTVRIWQAGAKDADPGAKPKDPKGGVEKKPAPRKKGELSPDEEMKLTIVQFGEKMWAEDFRKRAKFWTNVKVVHLPADSPTVNVDLREGEIPKGAIYLEARDTLEVFSTIQKEKDADGKEVDVAYQEMIAIGDVRVRKQGEFFGDADKVTYNEMKGTLTFHGTDKNPATIHRSKGQGLPVEKTSARVLIYYLKTKTVGQEGGRAIIE